MKLKNFFKKIGGFFKRNAYYVILFVCISGIATMITLAAVNGGSNNQIINDNENENENENEDENTNTQPIVFMLPVAEYEDGMIFSGTDFLFHITLGDYRTHKGTDFITEDAAEVQACFDGTVTQVYKTVPEGNVVVIKHNDELYTIYKSLSDDVEVEVGYNIKKGDVIGYTSNSMLNEYKEGPHLHLEVKYKDKLVDPMTFMEEGDK